LKGCQVRRAQTVLLSGMKNVKVSGGAALTANKTAFPTGPDDKLVNFHNEKAKLKNSFQAGKEILDEVTEIVKTQLEAAKADDSASRQTFNQDLQEKVSNLVKLAQDCQKQALKLESLVEKLEAWHQLGKIETRVLAAARTVSEKCIQQAALNLQVSKQIAHSSTFDELHFQVFLWVYQPHLTSTEFQVAEKVIEPGQLAPLSQSGLSK